MNQSSAVAEVLGRMADSAIVAEYRRRTPTSARFADEARHVLPGGITHDARHVLPYPLYVERAHGSRKWDVDGNEYVDYAGGHGALLLGHNHPVVTEAIQRQLERGTHFGTCHELELRWGALVQRLMPSAERLRFTSSGTEATLLAVRLARAATGRKKLLRFAGHFHGWHDHMAFGVSGGFDAPSSPGVLPEITENVVLAPPDDTQATERILAASDDIAAVIIEPTGASWGQVPVQPEFLHALRDATTRHGALLIFDEVISGFRCSPGGAQAVLGIRPDLTTLAKILAGGLPGGAVAGRRDVLELLEFADVRAAELGTDVAPRPKVPHHGTFNGNPLSAAAGIATLEIVATGDACQRASDYAERLRTALNGVIADERLDWSVYGTYSGFHVFTNPAGESITADDIAAGRVDYRTLKSRPDPALLMKLRLAMLVHGVELFSWPGGPTSAVHDERDLALTVAAFGSALQMLKDEGENGRR
ncbi:MAG: aspartate aminotransferase family protein [Pirellulales bacterium]